MGQLGSVSVAIALSIGLIACGRDGPSNTEAEKALQEQFAAYQPLLTALGQAPVKLSIKDMKCQSQGSDVYVCDVLISTGSAESKDRARFVKLGGKWHAEKA